MELILIKTVNIMFMELNYLKEIYTILYFDENYCFPDAYLLIFLK